MNKTKIAIIVCNVITATVLIGLAVWFVFGIAFDGGGFGFNFGGEMDIRTNYIFAADEIAEVHSVDIDWTAGRVTIGRHNADYIRVSEFSRRALRDNQQFGVNIVNGVLQVEFFESGARFTNSQSKQLEVWIPYSFGEFEDFNVSTVSGRIEMSEIEAYEVALHTTSGRIELRNVVADSANLRTVSGRISIENSEISDVVTHTTSGRHDLAGMFGVINSRSVSGRIEITGSPAPYRIDATTTSGRIEVRVPNEGEAISVSQSTTSGRITNEVPVVTGVADARYRLSTTSGRIGIYELR